MKRALVLGVLAAGLAAVPSLASPARYVAVRPAVVDPGDYVRVSGGGCGAHALVYLISPAFVGHAFVQHSVAAHATAGGTFARFVLIRSRLHAGRYAVTVRCDGGNLGVEAHLRVR
jgi:hypothetical protein